jgi:hypothetical protein
VRVIGDAEGTSGCGAELWAQDRLPFNLIQPPTQFLRQQTCLVRPIKHDAGNWGVAAVRPMFGSLNKRAGTRLRRT